MIIQVRPRDAENSRVVSIADDPENWYPAVANNWAVNERIEVGRRVPSGDIVNCTHLILSVGDFVDVTVVADISYRRNTGVSVHLAPTRVIQLTTAADFPSVSPLSAL